MKKSMKLILKNNSEKSHLWLCGVYLGDGILRQIYLLSVPTCR